MKTNNVTSLGKNEANPKNQRNSFIEVSKKIALALLMIFGLSSFAQEKTNRTTAREKFSSLTSEQKIELQVKKMTKELNLTEKQITDFRALATKQVEKREKKKEALQDMRNKKRTGMQAELAANKAEMQKILNAEQFAKWESIQEERKTKVKEKMAKVREDEPINKPAEEK